jgi:ABC-type branched-subunit amino acid transport system substrate-binding protein
MAARKTRAARARTSSGKAKSKPQSRRLSKTSEHLLEVRDRYRIGVMIDLPGLAGLSDMVPAGVAFALEEAHEEGLIDRPAQVIVREYSGQPMADQFTTLDAYRDLVENERVLGVAGPMTTDNCLAVLPEVERLGVPNITMCGTQQYVGRFAFNLSNGGMGDEPAVMAAWLKGEGHERIAVLKDYPSQIGDEYCLYFRYACASLGISIAAEEPTSPVATQAEMDRAMAAAKRSDPDALVYFGLGSTVRHLGPALRSLGWDPPRVMCTAFVGATYSEELAHWLEGWVGVDQYDERNTVLANMLQRYGAKHRGRGLTPNSATSCGYDMGRVLALGLGRMRISSPGALRDALETVRREPATTGAPGTVITFGPEDHRGFKGPDYLVLRRARGGKTEFVGTAPVAR